MDFGNYVWLVHLPQLVDIGDMVTRSVDRLIPFQIDFLSLSLSSSRPQSEPVQQQQQQQCLPCMTTYIHHKHTTVVVSTSNMSLCC